MEAVHPRACGEHTSSAREQNTIVGSSPRVRGTLPRKTPTDRTARFIPARAGNTQEGIRGHRKYTVHPRACGEHADRQLIKAEADGSSPRVRGTPTLSMPAHERRRFIPARAGNTNILE